MFESISKTRRETCGTRDRSAYWTPTVHALGPKKSYQKLAPHAIILVVTLGDLSSEGADRAQFDLSFLKALKTLALPSEVSLL